jgi:hypothetical protein
LSPGGVGQSLFTQHLHAMMGPLTQFACTHTLLRIIVSRRRLESTWQCTECMAAEVRVHAHTRRAMRHVAFPNVGCDAEVTCTYT